MVQDRVADLIAHLIRMSLGHGLGSEHEIFFHHDCFTAASGSLKAGYANITTLTEQGHLCLSELRQELGELVQTVILGPLPVFSSKTLDSKPTNNKLPLNGS